MSDATEQAGQPRRLSILLTEGSSISARQILYDLGPRHTIDILDPSPICQCRSSKYTRRWFRNPLFSRDPLGFLRGLGKRLRSGEYDVLVPPHDEVFLLSRVRDVLAQWVKVAIPTFESVEEIQSKIRFAEICDELGLPQPESNVVRDETELDRWTDYPRYCKLDYGTAGQTVRLVHDRKELDAALADFQEHGWWAPGQPVLMQREASGDQGFVRAVFRHGKLVGHHCTILRRRGVGGAAVAKISVRHPAVEEAMAKLGAHLKWHGVLFCDYFYDDATEIPRFIEANPRIGDSANPTLSGNNVIQRWVDVAMEEELPPPPEPRLGVKSHSSLLVMMSRGLEGWNRRQLWQEMRRLKKKTGLFEDSLDEMTRPREDQASWLPYAVIVTRLMLRPSSAHDMVRTTVSNYALKAEGADMIRELPREKLVACLMGEDE